jgi:hypothetical protein
MHRLFVMLEQAGLPIEPFPQGQPNITLATESLYSALANRRLHLRRAGSALVRVECCIAGDKPRLSAQQREAITQNCPRRCAQLCRCRCRAERHSGRHRRQFHRQRQSSFNLALRGFNQWLIYRKSYKRRKKCLNSVIIRGQLFDSLECLRARLGEKL